ncbi:hypothetical protein CERZMDRAFT_35128 [Cercospora zeae-maydis SCOH1-5]|uniref:tRNA(His) guanylyltransferase n=1 Tax=Cercospora zeae-maydis SCOH1-5 TaxID=717836 RepID=A0A6A6FQX0_9PEZI|nr:hypothetical protein CERZMDRAFT_35128 [Cercospora zeae-maydis SCOH1-5]
MANSEFTYVKNFEPPDSLPLSNWIVVRIDGRGFSKLCKKYNFTKPNDKRAIDLMNSAAVQVVKSFHDIVLAYGQSDEYSFVFHESTTLFERRSAKLSTSVATMFTAEYVMQWREFFPEEEMKLCRPFPTFDGRCVCYPKKSILRDYLSWRQADCHINNLYNTTFWSLVLKGGEDGQGMSGTEAEKMLKGTLASDKNEILWKNFGVNYNDEEEVFKKGSVLYRAYDDAVSKTQLEKERKRKMKARIVTEHTDIIGNAFWEKRPYILATKKGDVCNE